MVRKILIAAVLLIICAGAGAYLLREQGDVVYFRIIEEPADALDASRVEWLRQKDNAHGVHLYALETSNPYELLVYDNAHRGMNLYRTSTLRARLFDGTLRIDIDEEDAVDDSFVQDSLLAYFIIKDKPVAIDVYRNGVKESYDAEAGTETISKE